MRQETPTVAGAMRGRSRGEEGENRKDRLDEDSVWYKDVSFATLLSARYRRLSSSPVWPTRYFRLHQE